MPPKSAMSRILTVACCGLALILVSGCAGKNKKDQKLAGERISVMTLEQNLSVDPTVQDIQVRLPVPAVNREWPQVGGYPTHAMYHLALNQGLSIKWRRKVADGSSGNRPLIAEPVVAEGKVFIYDADEHVVAVDAETGRRLWRVQMGTEGEKRDSGFGGGIAYDKGRLFVTTGWGYMDALDAENGHLVWEAKVGVPLRGAPTIGGGQVYAVTHDNQLYAFNEKTGEYLWYHVGIAENAGILGAASPALSGQSVIAAFSSGELFALRTENGSISWSDSLTRTGRLTPLSSINDIDGEPVVDGDRVFAISHGDRMVSIDLRTGNRVWERNIAGINTPWVAGDFIFVVTTDAQLVALYRPNGKVRWIMQLQKYENMDKGKHPISWSGPILAGNRLIVVGSNGYVVSVSPFTGKLIDSAKAADRLMTAPVIANKTLYVLDDDGNLYAMQ